MTRSSTMSLIPPPSHPSTCKAKSRKVTKYHFTVIHSNISRKKRRLSRHCISSWCIEKNEKRYLNILAFSHPPFKQAHLLKISFLNRGAKNVHTKKFNLHFVSGSGQNFECEWNLVRDHAERQKWKWRWDSHFHLQKCEWNSNFHLHSAAPRRRALLKAITGQIDKKRD